MTIDSAFILPITKSPPLCFYSVAMMDLWLTPAGAGPTYLWRNFRSDFFKTIYEILRKVGISIEDEEKCHCMLEQKSHEPPHDQRKNRMMKEKNRNNDV